jgi:hypothetical protein
LLATVNPELGILCTCAEVNVATEGVTTPIAMLFIVPAVAVSLLVVIALGLLAPIVIPSIVPPPLGAIVNNPLPVGLIITLAFTPVNVAVSVTVNKLDVISMLLIVPPFAGFITTVPELPLGDSVITAFSPWAVKLPVVVILLKLPIPLTSGSTTVIATKGI